MINLSNKHSPEQLAISDFDHIFSQFSLSGLNGMHLFLTGGTGFFGFWILMAISCLNVSGANISVVALSRDPKRFLTSHPFFKQCQWLSFCQGDVIDYTPPIGDFDLFIHGATDTSPSAMASPVHLFQSMVKGTEYVLQHALSAKAQRVLIISSGAVYGEQPPNVDKISEDEFYVGSSLNINNVYGEGKRAMEMLGACYTHSYDIEIVTARCFSFLGYGLPQHLAIGQLISDALYADDITVKGDGKPVRSYLYSADLAVWLLAVLLRGKNGSAYNVGSDATVTIANVAQYIKDTLSPSKVITVKNGGDGIHKSRMIYVPDISKPCKELGVKVWTPLPESIKRHSEFS